MDKVQSKKKKKRPGKSKSKMRDKMKSEEKRHTYWQTSKKSCHHVRCQPLLGVSTWHDSNESHNHRLLASITSLRSINYFLFRPFRPCCVGNFKLSVRVCIFHLKFIRYNMERYDTLQNISQMSHISDFFSFYTCLLFTQSQSSDLIVKSNVSYNVT